MANKGADNFGDDDFYDPHDDVYNDNGEVSNQLVVAVIKLRTCFSKFSKPNISAT